MLYSLSSETKLDIFKCLSYQQLLAFKQTNVYLRDFVNKYEGELAKEKFTMICLGDIGGFNGIPRKLINTKAEDFDFPMTKEIEEKFKNGFKKPIPLFLSGHGTGEIDIYLEKVDKSEEYVLRLPPIIKSKEDIQIVYHYLNKLFKCSFKCSYFEDYIINPELIELLFGEAKQFYVQNCNISIQNRNIGILMRLILNNLASEYHRISFQPMGDDTMKKYKDDLFKILLNGGDKFGKVNVMFHCTPGFYKNVYNHIVEYVATSKDVSKMVAIIILDFSNCESLKLHDKATNVEVKKLNDKKSTTYQVVNIHDPTVKFSFCNEESFYVRITIMKE
uniref:Uncharacterized protein n=1 Tax=Meloidogyne enterolobii TaxID=390850 RepID=A0A6V7WE90_MELEN|nr:unnamed protein product [Meloidogyne enterolobii]